MNMEYELSPAMKEAIRQWVDRERRTISPGEGDLNPIARILRYEGISNYLAFLSQIYQRHPTTLARYFGGWQPAPRWLRQRVREDFGLDPEEVFPPEESFPHVQRQRRRWK